MKRVNVAGNKLNAAPELQEVFLTVSELEMKPVPDFQEVVSHMVEEEHEFPEINPATFSTWNMPPQDVSISKYPANGLLF